MLLRLKKNALCVMQIVKLLNLRDIKFIWKEAAQLPLLSGVAPRAIPPLLS